MGTDKIKQCYLEKQTAFCLLYLLTQGRCPRLLVRIMPQVNALRFPLVSKHKRELNEQEYW